MLPNIQQNKVASLNALAKERSLSASEEQQREICLKADGENMVRRARSAVLLQSRGYNMSDPAVLEEIL